MSKSSSSSLNPRCFFDFEIDGNQAGRVVFELFANLVPKTAENFRALCTGEKGVSKASGVPLHYRGSSIHRVIADFMIQGGDFTHRNGTGGESIYGAPFADENLKLKHDEPFLLSMANRGPDTNGSQFFITTKPCAHLNGKHVVFGRVVAGKQIIEQIERLSTDERDKPFNDVGIVHCGELELRRPSEDVVSVKKSSKLSDSESGSDQDERRKRHKKSKKKHGKTKKHRKHSRQSSVDGKSKLDLPDILPVQESVTVNEPQKLESELESTEAAQQNIEQSAESSVNTTPHWEPESTDNQQKQMKNRSPSPQRRYKGRGIMRYRTPPHLRQSRPRSRSPRRDF